MDDPIERAPEWESSSNFIPDWSNGIAARLNDRWTVEILWQLACARHHKLRFSELMKRTGKITQRMLTLTLRNLERDGLVARHYFSEIPPRVEYELTDLGAGLLRALENVNAWLRENLPRINEHRRVYDHAVE